MMQLNGSSFSPTVTPSDYKPMSCAKCQDVLTTVPDSAAKGGSGLMAQGAPTKTMVTHLCESCKTTVKVAQAGKNSPPDMVNHKCTSCGSENAACCNTTKSSDVATAGMDKK